jgi:putative DNA primase/helicase
VVLEYPNAEAALTTHADAKAALGLLRQTFCTFPFADAPRYWDRELGVEVVDITQSPERDESAFLVELLTAVCRPSLWLAPGALVVAPGLSGAGTGKGLLVRATSAIAFGVRPRAFTMGGERHELDKRLAAELIEAQPILFLDNANGHVLRSETLASVLTERPARVRLLGRTLMVPLNSTAFIAITGNGLTVTEDLARRFILCELDARCEDPEGRPFRPGFLDQIERRRAELLTAGLTIWRLGRQSAPQLTRGKPLGSFETWAEWCRDPLLALGCRDPVERVEALKANDPRRQRIAELFQLWWDRHGATPMKVHQLADAVKAIADPQGRGRQYLATFIAGLAGTHAAGFVLTRQEPAGKWSAATYALTQATPVGRTEA